MSGSKYLELLAKYVRDTDKAVLPKERNPFPQMKTDTFRLTNDAGFGGLGGSVDWAYIHEPVNMFPQLAVSEKARYVTIMGGSGINYMELHGEVEITLGKSREDAKTFKFGEAVAFYVGQGMLYNINVTKIDNKSCPIHFNELICGEQGPTSDNDITKDSSAGYDKYFASGEALWAKGQPHHEVVYPVMQTNNNIFGSKEKIRRTWMPVSEPHVLAEHAHFHNYLEYIVFYGSDPDNITDLGGIVEFTIGEDKDNLTMFRIDKSTIFCVSPGLWHSPMDFVKINDKSKPIVFCEVSYTGGFDDPTAKTEWLNGPPQMPPSPAAE
ncbi:MAG: hypothetical protein FWH33_09600 [Oscillospiraceae bacterium]|nr:hypothetical protein [Oscillospiraceae bacterium]